LLVALAGPYRKQHDPIAFELFDIKAMALSDIDSSDHEQHRVKRKRIGDGLSAEPNDGSKVSFATKHAPYWNPRDDTTTTTSDPVRDTKRAFRLLILHGNQYNKGSHFCVDLMRVHINKKNATDPLSSFDAQLPDYDAVSYAWGKSAQDRTIWCTARTPLDYSPNEPFQQVLDRSDRGS
jgi:hypothetical protein